MGLLSSIYLVFYVFCTEHVEKMCTVDFVIKNPFDIYFFIHTVCAMNIKTKATFRID